MGSFPAVSTGWYHIHKNKSGDTPKARKPTHLRQQWFIDTSPLNPATDSYPTKWGEITETKIQWKERWLTSPKGELELVERNRWCCPHWNTNLLTGMRKGRVMLWWVAPKGSNSIQTVGGSNHIGREESLSSLAGQKVWGVLYFLSNKIWSNRDSTSW